MKLTEEQRAEISKEAKGRTIETFEYELPGDGLPGYWVMTFTDGTELSMRLMIELT